MKYKKSAVVLVFNDEAELALQLRAINDKSYALHWDFSAAGGIEDGEDYEEAARRELREEIGIDAKLKFVGEELYKDSLVRNELIVYKTVSNGPFSPNPKEVEEVKFYNFHEITEMMASGTKFHPQFFFLWDKGVIMQALDIKFD